MNINLDPDFIITDFELAAIRACKSAFPNAKHKCCYFHLSQNIWKHIQKEGLSKKYISDSNFAHQMRHLAALAFLDPTEIPSAFEIVREQIIPKEAEKVVDWFSEYYVDGFYKRATNPKEVSTLKLTLKKSAPRFPPQTWSVLDCVNAGIPTTQNNIENWHNRWNSLLNRKKFNIFKSMKELQKEQKNTSFEIERINANIKKRKYKQSCHILKIRQQLLKKNDVDLKEYLSGLAYIAYLKT